MTIKIQDAAQALPLTGVNITPEGYLQANVFAVRTGIQIYTRDELAKAGVENLPNKPIITLYRSPEEVFKRESVASFARKPLTNDHPAENVMADNWKALAIGETDGEVMRDGERLRIPMTFRDAAAIADLHAGKRQVSAGYVCDMDMTPGIAPDGTAFDGQQINITGNHVAIVHRGRAGESFRVGDSAGNDGGSPRPNWGLAPINDAEIKEDPMTLRNIIVDGLQVETTDAGAAAISKLQNQLRDSAALVETRDRELADLQGKLDKANAAVPTADAIAEMVEKRGALIADARSIADIDYRGCAKDEDVRRAAVKAKLGDAAVAGKSDAYVEVRFDDLARDAAASTKKPDPVRSTLGDKARVSDGLAGWDDVLKSNGFAQ